MAYISQDEKKKLAPEIKKVLKKYGVKGTIGINHHSSLVVNIWEGALDFIGASQKHVDMVNQQKGMQYCGNVDNYIQVNNYHEANWMREVGENKIADFYDELVKAMKGTGWYDKSDAMTDYFDTAYYLDINIGKWNKGYVYNAA